MRHGSRSRCTIGLYATAAAVLIADQVTKLMARRSLDYDRPLPVIHGFFDLRLSYNRGAAFGLLPDWAPLFILIALVFIYATVRVHYSVGPDSPQSGLPVGLGLLLGGAAGNLIDRLASPNHTVTDFVSLYIRYRGKKYAWPTFNLADAAIVIGALLVLFFVYLSRRPET